MGATIFRAWPGRKNAAHGCIFLGQFFDLVSRCSIVLSEFELGTKAPCTSWALVLSTEIWGQCSLL